MEMQKVERQALPEPRESYDQRREMTKRSRDMWTLAASFPTLTGWATTQSNAGTEFDGDAVLAALKESWVSSGSRHALLFIGDIWNSPDMRPLYPKSLRGMSIVDAWAIWDNAHRTAALAWLERPWWP